MSRLRTFRQAVRLSLDVPKLLPGARFNPARFVARWGKKRPHDPAVIFENLTFTWRVVDLRVGRYAAWFESEGVQAGDVVVKVNGDGFKKGWQEALEMILYSSAGVVRLDITRNGQPMAISYNLVPNPLYEGLGYPFMSPLLPTRVGDVMAGSPAQKAGLRQGDVLLEINGESVINAELLVRRIENML